MNDNNNILKKYHDHLIKTAGQQPGDFNSALITVTAQACLNMVQDIIKDIPHDEKWTALGVAESIEMRLATLFGIDLHTGAQNEQQAETGSNGSQ